MAKTKVRQESQHFKIVQKRFLGRQQRLVARIDRWAGRTSLRALCHGIKIKGKGNKKGELPFRQRVQLNLGDIVELPWGGRFEVTENVLRGAAPIIVHG